jgi:2-polyprenyl-6-methoxyphenol hydroxylase-like FAD-dependent oxidoreductase
MSASRITTDCCIVGGGPAGVMLGLLLAKGGLDVVLLEKHLDFFRDFRGDTIHPSTLDLIDQLGLRQHFDAIPQTSFDSLDMVLNGTRIRPVDFRHLRGPNRKIVLMPQWDFLDLLVDEAKRLRNFHLYMGADVSGLTSEGGRVTGATATIRTGAEGDSATHDISATHELSETHELSTTHELPETHELSDTLTVSATLTVGADGRSSVVRAAAKLPVREYGVAIDVLWFRLPKPEMNPPSTLGYISEESMVVTIPRLDYYQTAMLIPKGDFDAVRERGITAFRGQVVRAAEFLEPVITTVTDWNQVKLLSVQINRLRRWHKPGLLCIGDAAHAMSPAFGVGINYAIQDAVAAANILCEPLATGTLSRRELAAVQRRRLWPVRLMQPIQLTLHRRIAKPGGGAILSNPPTTGARIVLAVVVPLLRRVMARVVGRGFRPEKIRADLVV